MTQLSHHKLFEVETHQNVAYFQGALNCGINECTMRCGLVTETHQQELIAFQRGSNPQLDSVLRSIATYTNDGKVYFVYNHYKYTIGELCKTEHFKVTTGGRLTNGFLNLIRGIFFALDELHWEHKTTHNNLNVRNIVTIETDGQSCVKLTGLGLDIHERDVAYNYELEKRKDCCDLEGILRAIVLHSLRSAPIPPMFEALMKNLMKSGCRNLANSIFLLSPYRRLSYLAVAFRRVRIDDKHTNRFHTYFLRILPTDWTKEARKNRQLELVLDYPSAKEYKTTPVSFLRFCRNAVMHYPTTIQGYKSSFQEQWRALYHLCPNFFNKLHDFFISVDIFIFE
ncbi:unnamed protein product [Linum tenue]|nr:unnamed protein product [Linum tenue]